MNKKVLFILFQSFFIIMQANAHGDLQKRINKVTQEIKITPDSAYLYFKRGKLLFQHKDFNKSITDLNKSKILGHVTTEQNLIFAKNHFGLNQFQKTLFFLDEILCNDSFNVIAIKIKAQAYFKLNDFKKAAVNFEKMIEYTNQTLPENYIDASIAWESLKTKEGDDKSIKIIKEGITDLGELLSLYQRLISLEINQKNYDEGIEQQKHVLSLLNRKESAYYKLSDLYILNENYEQALENIQLAKTHFNKLPLRIQNTSNMKELLDKIIDKETKLQTKLNN